MTDREQQLEHALRMCIPWVATSRRGMAQQALAVACDALNIDPYQWSNAPDVLTRRRELLGLPDRRTTTTKASSPQPNERRWHHLPTQIVPQISRKLAEAYETTQRELAKNQDMTGQVWDEALTKLQGFDPSDPTFPQFIDAHASVSILEQVLTSVSGQAGFFNGNQQNR